MKRIAGLIALALVLALTVSASADLPLCSCPYCEGALDSQCLTYNGNPIACTTYLRFAACP